MGRATGATRVAATRKQLRRVEGMTAAVDETISAGKPAGHGRGRVRVSTTEKCARVDVRGVAVVAVAMLEATPEVMPLELLGARHRGATASGESLGGDRRRGIVRSDAPIQNDGPTRSGVIARTRVPSATPSASLGTSARGRPPVGTTTREEQTGDVALVDEVSTTIARKALRPMIRHPMITLVRASSETGIRTG